MFTILMAAATVGLPSSAQAESRFTAQEQAWLQAAEPVLHEARAMGLPLDIIVQPQARPNDVPFAMGYDGQRCKLVLSMRGGGDPDAPLAGLAPRLLQAAREAVAAHELAHCWRNVQGRWHQLPAGFSDRSQYSGAPQLLRAAREQELQRREEGYADLAALAWSAAHHAADYAALYGWLHGLRATAAGAHDTGVWLQLAPSAAAFSERPRWNASVEGLWQQGLLRGE